MQLYDPTASGPRRSLSRAAPLTGLDGKTMGILENGKLNAKEMLHEVALLFEERHGCKVSGLLQIERKCARASRDFGEGCPRG